MASCLPFALGALAAEAEWMEAQAKIANRCPRKFSRRPPPPISVPAAQWTWHDTVTFTFPPSHARERYCTSDVTPRVSHFEQAFAHSCVCMSTTY